MGLRVGIGLFVLACAGCGIDESGLEPLDGSPPLADAQIVDVQNPTDAAPPTDATAADVVKPPVEAGPCDDDASSCTSPEVPAGWTPVAYVENPTAPCAAPFATQDDVVAILSNGNADCACTCTKTADPDCTTGKIATFYSDQQGCGLNGLSLTFTNGGCVQLNGLLHMYYASQAIAPSGGSCSVQATSSGALQTAPARLCAPDSSCTSAACGGYAPAGYAACIVATGNQACPGGSSFTQKHAIAASATASCAPTCGTSCTLNGTCQTPKVHFFSDGQCNNPVVTMPSDTTCNSTGGGVNVGGATYTSTYNLTSCATPGTSTVQVDATAPRTVCCRP